MNVTPDATFYYADAAGLRKPSEHDEIKYRKEQHITSYRVRCEVQVWQQVFFLH